MKINENTCQNAINLLLKEMENKLLKNHIKKNFNFQSTVCLSEKELDTEKFNNLFEVISDCHHKNIKINNNTTIQTLNSNSNDYNFKISKNIYYKPWLKTVSFVPAICITKK